ncbi:MAG: heat-inducible transcription repressor HrcA [Myxococcales bacterium]|nr:heat-inducible transcription repressor HrcA [Myxococcales bacterium]
MSELNHRARKILTAIVQEYIATGSAVGSRTVTRRYGIDLSAATVRNVMADLEEQGLLKQPHTSSGRVPTHDGLRVFVDSLLKVRAFGPRERDELRAHYNLPQSDLDEALQRTSRALSELSRQAAIVITPVAERQRLEHVEFVRLREGELLAILVVEGGQVENKLVRVDPMPDAAELERVHNYLNLLIVGRTLEEVRHFIGEELAKERTRYDLLAERTLRLGQLALMIDREPGVIVSGSAHLLDDEAGDSLSKEALRAVLSALEQRERVVELLDRTLGADGIRVWLGSATPFAEIADLSVVAASYGPEDRPVGTIAVIGPTRMNYSRVIPLVDFTAELLSDVMALGK